MLTWVYVRDLDDDEHALGGKCSRSDNRVSHTTELNRGLTIEMYFKDNQQNQIISHAIFEQYQKCQNSVSWWNLNNDARLNRRDKHKWQELKSHEGDALLLQLRSSTSAQLAITIIKSKCVLPTHLVNAKGNTVYGTGQLVVSTKLENSKQNPAKLNAQCTGENGYENVFRLVKLFGGQVTPIYSDSFSDLVRAFNKFDEDRFICCMYRGRVVDSKFGFTEQGIPMYAVLECYINRNGGSGRGSGKRQLKISTIFYANKRRCGGHASIQGFGADINGSRVTDLCTATSGPVLSVISNQTYEDSNPGTGQTQNVRVPATCGLWVTNVTNSKKAFIEMNEGILHAITTVAELEKAINDSLLLELNKHSLTSLGFLQKCGKCSYVVVVDRTPCKGNFALKQKYSTWRYSTLLQARSQQSDSSIMVSDAAYHNLSFEQHSIYCHDLFQNPDFRHRKPAKSIYEALNLSRPLKMNQSRRADFIRNGLMGKSPCQDSASAGTRASADVPASGRDFPLDTDHAGTDLVEPELSPPESQNEASDILGASIPAAGTWHGSPFPKELHASDIKMNGKDHMMPEGPLCLSQTLVLAFCQQLNAGKCVINHIPRGKRIRVNMDAGGKDTDAFLYPYLFLHCRGKSKENPLEKCSYSATYTKIFKNGNTPSSEGPMYRLVLPRKGKSELSECHTCCKGQSEKDCSSSIKGKQTLPMDHFTFFKARLCYAYGDSLNTIMLALGYDELSTAFEVAKKSLYDRIRNTIRNELKVQFPMLRGIFNDLFASGHLAYASLCSVPGRDDQVRMYWSLTPMSNSLNSREAEVVSLDFKHDLLDQQAFGHLTIRTASGKLAPVAMFVVESENKDSLAWIAKNFENNHRRLGIENLTRVIAHDDHAGHAGWPSFEAQAQERNGRFFKTSLYTTLITLRDGRKLSMLAFRHNQFTGLLCLGPTHAGRAIKKQISKLRLAHKDRIHVTSLVYEFLLDTFISEPIEMDFQMQELTRKTMKICKVQVDENFVCLPAHVRFGDPRRSPSGSRLHQSDSYHTRLLHHDELVENLSTDPLASFEEISTDAIQKDKDTIIRSIIASKLSQQEMKLQYSRLQNINLVLNERKQTKAQNLSNDVTPRVVGKAMLHLYENFNSWTQRSLMQAFTMGIKSSVFSEVENSSIDRFMTPTGARRTGSSLPDFVCQTNEWAQGQHERAYQASQKKEWVSEIFTDSELSMMRDLLQNHAIKSLLKAAAIATKHYAFSKEKEVPIERVCRLMRARVGLICGCLGIDTNKISYYQAEPKQVFTFPSSASSATGNHLKTAFHIVNSDVTKSVIAVYKPGIGNECKISFLSRADFESFVVMCSCQKQTGFGYACPCQLAWILAQINRSIENIIWLCHPSFVRGHVESSTEYVPSDHLRESGSNVDQRLHSCVQNNCVVQPEASADAGVFGVLSLAECPTEQDSRQLGHTASMMPVGVAVQLADSSALHEASRSGHLQTECPSQHSLHSTLQGQIAHLGSANSRYFGVSSLEKGFPGVSSLDTRLPLHYTQIASHFPQTPTRASNMAFGFEAPLGGSRGLLGSSMNQIDTLWRIQSDVLGSANQSSANQGLLGAFSPCFNLQRSFSPQAARVEGALGLHGASRIGQSQSDSRSLSQNSKQSSNSSSQGMQFVSHRWQRCLGDSTLGALHNVQVN